jgi:hypothetical protein
MEKGVIVSRFTLLESNNGNRYRLDSITRLPGELDQFNFKFMADMEFCMLQTKVTRKGDLDGPLNIHVLEHLARIMIVFSYVGHTFIDLDKSVTVNIRIMRSELWEFNHVVYLAMKE